MSIRDYATVGETGQIMGVSPKDVSDLFYRGRLSETVCPLVGRRRFIPKSYLPVVRAALVQYGYLPSPESVPEPESHAVAGH